MRSILITGGCGFLGTSLVERLLQQEQPPRIRILDNLIVGSRADLAEVCRFHEIAPTDIAKSRPPDVASFTAGSRHMVELLVGDIRDFSTCLAASSGMDAVVHFAANTGVGPSVEDPRADMEANVIGTFNMLEAARQRGTKRFVFASSGAPIGEVEPPIHEEKAPRPVSPYGASKLAGEGYCSAYWRSFGIGTVSLRFGNVYGPRSKHKSSIVAKFFRQALAGETLEIYGDGSQTRDFIHVDDLIDAVICAFDPSPATTAAHDPAARPPWGEVYQIATARETTVNEIAEDIRRIVESATGRPVTIAHAAPHLGDVSRNYSDVTKARIVLGWSPRHDLQAGLRATFDYFLNTAVASPPATGGSR